jgi:hypothetical protein
MSKVNLVIVSFYNSLQADEKATFMKSKKLPENALNRAKQKSIDLEELYSYAIAFEKELKEKGRNPLANIHIATLQQDTPKQEPKTEDKQETAQELPKQEPKAEDKQETAQELPKQEPPTPQAQEPPVISSLTQALEEQMKTFEKTAEQRANEVLGRASDRIERLKLANIIANKRARAKERFEEIKQFEASSDKTKFSLVIANQEGKTFEVHNTNTIALIVKVLKNAMQDVLTECDNELLKLEL